MSLHAYSTSAALALIAALILGPLDGHAQQSRGERLGYIGTVTVSDDPNDRAGEIVFSNLTSQTPTVSFPSGKADTFAKVFEDEETMVLFFVGYLSGSTTTFYLNKKTLRFARVDVGVLEARALRTDPKPTTQYGTLR